MTSADLAAIRAIVREELEAHAKRMDWPCILERLNADSANWAAIARAIGLPRMTVARIGSGETPAPRVDTAQKIAGYYARLDAPEQAA